MRDADGLDEMRDEPMPSAQEAGRSASDRGAVAFVWGIWALMLLAALFYVMRYNSNVPIWDDYSEVPYLTGHKPVTAAWLWSQHNEHRNPLQRLILLALARLSGCDFRAGIIFSVLALGGTAAVMILGARRLRGRVDYPDAFFPLALLHWGQGEVLRLGHAADIVLAAVIANILLVIIAGIRGRGTLMAALLAGICLILLPLCGGMGLARVPLLALWLGWWGVLQRRSPSPYGRRDGALMLALAAAALVLVPLYFIDYHRPVSHPPSSSLRASLMLSVQSLSMGFGLAAAEFWPLSGLVTLGLFLASLAVLAVVWRNQPQDRLRTLGLFLFLLDTGLVALAIGLARSGLSPLAGLKERYATTSVLALCCMYYIWGSWNRPSGRSWGQMCLFTLMAFTIAFNTQAGRADGRLHREGMKSFEQDMQMGIPLSILNERHTPFLYPTRDYLPDRLRELRDAGVGQFRSLKEDPPLEEVPLPVKPTGVEQVTWNEGTAQATVNAPSLTFALPEPRFIWGIRIAFTRPDDEGTSASLGLSWKRDHEDNFSESRSFSGSYIRGTEEQTMTVLIGEPVAEFRIRLDHDPGTFKISKLVLLVPVTHKGPIVPGPR